MCSTIDMRGLYFLSGQPYDLDMNNAAKMVRLSGPTYEIKDIIREAGGQFDGASKTWTVTQEGFERIDRVVGNRHAGSNKRDRAARAAWDAVVAEDI